MVCKYVGHCPYCHFEPENCICECCGNLPLTVFKGQHTDMRQDVARVATEALKEAGKKPETLAEVWLYVRDLQAQIDELREKLKGLGGV